MALSNVIEFLSLDGIIPIAVASSMWLAISPHLPEVPVTPDDPEKTVMSVMLISLGGLVSAYAGLFGHLLEISLEKKTRPLVSGLILAAMSKVVLQRLYKSWVARK